jgi:hypothetical protein
MAIMMTLADFKHTYESQLKGLPESRIAGVHRKIRGMSDTNAILSAISAGHASYSAEKQKNRRPISGPSSQINSPILGSDLLATKSSTDAKNSAAAQQPEKEAPILSTQNDIDPNEVRRAINYSNEHLTQSVRDNPQKEKIVSVISSAPVETMANANFPPKQTQNLKSRPNPTKLDLEKLWRPGYDAKCAMAHIQPLSLKRVLYDKYMDICDDVIKTMGHGSQSDECIIAKCGRMYMTVDDLFELYEFGSRRQPILDVLHALQF